MLSFAYPWLIVLLPVPWAVARLMKDYREARPALRVPFLQRLAEASGQMPGEGSAVLGGHRGQKLLLLVAWLLLVCALARPQWLEEPIVEEHSLRDMLLLVDLSGSMLIEDFSDAEGQQTDRLTAVKGVLADFLEAREGDRIGLIFFGSAAFVQAPFTDDTETLKELLDEALVGMAGPKTVIGDALGLALKLFEQHEVKERVVILLTDGNDTGSVVPPEQAAQIAHDEGVVVHVVGVGSDTAQGEQPLDEVTLKAIAKASDGQYFKAEDRQGLVSIYEKLDALTPKLVEGRSYRPRTDVYHWPLGLLITLLLTYHLALGLRYGIRTPGENR